jgi:hypothetical protein
MLRQPVKEETDVPKGRPPESPRVACAFWPFVLCAVAFSAFTFAAGCVEKDLSCSTAANCPDAHFCVEGTCTYRTDEAVFGPLCSAGCVGDLVREFNFEQGGSTGRWRYLDDGRDNLYREMALFTIDGLVHFVGDEPAPRPTVLYCPAYTDADACEGAESTLLLTPSSAQPAHHDVTLAWTAPNNGSFQLVGDFKRIGDGALEFVVHRNSRDDVVSRTTIGGARVDGAIDTVVELLAGDRLLVTVRAASSGEPASLAVHLRVNDLIRFPDTCALAVTFDDGKAVDMCGSVTYQPRRANGDGYEDTTVTPVAGPFGLTGGGANVIEGDYLLPTGLAMNYASSFTVQMWVRLPAVVRSTLYADWDSALPGGINIGTNGGRYSVVGLYENPNAPDGVGDVFVEWTWPDDLDWHFLRVTRDAALGTLRVCLDGLPVGGTTLDASIDLSPAEPPFIARNMTYNPPYFVGDIDDVRVFRRALPCGQ